MGNALTTLPLGVALKQLTYLEEEHHEDGLGELRLSPWQEADEQGTDSSYRHQEMLVEPVAFDNSFGCLFEGVETYI